ncbi:MAG: hypothetical protein V8S36_08465 [Lachnospiraceae bacterium]
MKKAVVQEQWVLLWIVALACVHGVIEQHLIELEYFPFFLAVFGTIAKEEPTGEKKIVQRLHKKGSSCPHEQHHQHGRAGDIYLLINFVLRRFFIQYFGVEILGINGVLADVLNTLSLAELGIQSAITFRLYEPLAKGRMGEVNEIITLFRKLYWAIGCFFVVAGYLSVCLFSDFLLKMYLTAWDISGLHFFCS